MTTTPDAAYVAVLPLFFTEEESYWLTDDLLPYIEAELRIMHEWIAPNPLAIFTNSVALADTLNREHVKVVPWNGNSLYPLPFGTRQALEQLKKDHPEARVLIRDIRQPGVRADQVGEILSLQGNGIAISASPPRDHPCQLYKGFRPEGMGFLHLLDPEFGQVLPSYLATKPFLAPFGVLLECENDKYFDAVDLCDGIVTPVDPKNGEAARRILIASVTPSRYRLFFPRSELPENAEGVSFFVHDAPQAILVRNQSSYSLRFDTDEMNPGLRASEAMVVTAMTCDGDISLPFEPRKTIDLFFKPYGNGLFYFPSQQVEEGESTLSLRHQDINRKWRFENNTLIRSDTRQVIFGRQNFPEVLSLDAALTVGPIDDLLRLSKGEDNVVVRAFPAFWDTGKILNIVDALHLNLKTDVHACREGRAS